MLASNASVAGVEPDSVNGESTVAAGGAASDAGFGD